MSFDDVELLEIVLFDGDAESGRLVAQFDIAVHRLGSPSKMYQNSSLPTSTSTAGKNSAIGEFRLAITTWKLCIWPACGITGTGVRLGERGDLAGLRQAADSIGVELDVVHRTGFEQLAETVQGEFVLSARIGIRPIAFNSA